MVSQQNFQVNPFPSIRLYRVLLLLLLCGFLRSPVGAAESAGAGGFLLRAWPIEAGLPQNKVTAVVQTHDGYLWVGTYSGLARFDGVRFTLFDEKNTPAIHGGRVTALYEAPDGTLWTGYENGELTSYRDGKFQAVDVPGWRAEKIHGITADEHENIWLQCESGLLVRVSDGAILSPPHGTAVSVFSLTRGLDGRPWVVREGKLSRVRDGKLQDASNEPAGTSSYVQGICTAYDGGIWAAANGRLFKWNGSSWRDVGAAPWEQTPLTCLTETSRGALLAGTSNKGFYLLFPATGQAPLHFNRSSDFPADWIMALVEDREQNLWVGTGGTGLIEMRHSNIGTLSPPDHWRGRAVLSVYPSRDGGLWMGTEGAGVYHYANGEWNNFGYTNGIGNSYVWSIAEDADGRLFCGTWGAGLFCREDDHFAFAPGLEHVMYPMPAMVRARNGGFWIGTSEGLLRWQNGRTNWFGGPDGIPLRDVRTIAEAADGAVWFGTEGSGLACLKNGLIRQFRRSDGLSSDYVECLHFSGDGALWIGTFGGGLCRLKDGRFSVIDHEQGLPNSVIGHIEEDGRGFFWMSSHAGILRAATSELNACADGSINKIRCLAYGINDGLPTIECSEGLEPSGCKTPDGRLWFPTSKGLVVVDPNDVQINPLPPAMALEEFVVDGEPVIGASPRIPPGRSHFEFHYTGLSFVAPEKVRFKYRIEGLEKDWVEAGTRRSATYSFIPPGQYTFHVIACNNDDVWNETGVSLPFTVRPHFWQTWWFHVMGGFLTIVAAGGSVWFETRRRMRRRLEKLEREKAIERERTRIAKDIHDDLGASLTRITMLSQSACGEPDVPVPVAENLNRIFGTARELTRAMDEIVWAVNPRHDTLDSLANYLSRFAYDFLSATGVRCRLDVPMQLPALPVTAEIRHNLFLAFKESLNNLVKHARATEANIILQMEKGGLLLNVVDNGCGFVPENAGSDTQGIDRLSGGNGLLNMRRRLAEIDGTCEISSKPGKGTTVSFYVPLDWTATGGAPAMS